MTKYQIKKRIEEIKDTVDFDIEVAHRLEDDLLFDFVEYVIKKDSDKDLIQLAKEILKLKKLEHSRHCA